MGGELHPVVRSQPHREPGALHEPVDGPREHLRHRTDAHLRSEGGTELEHRLGDLGRLAHRRVEAHVSARNRRVRGDDLQHAQIECIERIASRPRDDDRADGVLVAQHRGHHHRLAGNQPRPAVDHGAGGRGVGDRGPFVGVRFAAFDRRESDLVTDLGTQIEARGVEPVLADQLGDDRVSDLALRAGVRQTGRERSQEAHLGQQPVAGAGRDDVRRRLGRPRARRRAGGDQLRGTQLVGPERPRRARRPHQMGDRPAARAERCDQEGIPPIACLGRLAVDILDDRGQPGLAEAVRRRPLASPSGGDGTAGRPGSDDPGRIEVEELAEEPARRLVTKRGHRHAAAAGGRSRLGLRGASRRGRRVVASQPWVHDSQEARSSAGLLASPERGNAMKIT